MLDVRSNSVVCVFISWYMCMCTQCVCVLCAQVMLDSRGLNIQSCEVESDVCAHSFEEHKVCRTGVFLSSFFSLPLITKFLTRFAIPLSNYGSISDKFGTGITILYGTLISVTLSILYERQTRISSEVAKESSMLVLLTRNILEIFKEDEARLLAAGDCISNQVRILVKESRGAELLTMLYDDPYIGIVDLLYERGEHVSLWNSQALFLLHKLKTDFPTCSG